MYYNPVNEFYTPHSLSFAFTVKFGSMTGHLWRIIETNFGKHT